MSKAIADYSIALRYSPSLAWARCHRAEAYRQRGESARALADLEEVLRLEPYNEQALRGRCFVYVFNLPDYDRARADANEVIRLNPKNPNGYVCRSIIYFAKGEKAKGLGDWITALSLEPSSLCFRGSCKPNSLSLGIGFCAEPEEPPLENDSDKRIAACTKCLAGNPNNVAAYYERAWSYARNEAFKRALADFDEIIRRDPADAEARAERGDAQRCLKEYAEAIEDYTVAIQLDPANANYYVNRAKVYSTQKQYEKAWRDYNAALHIDPNIPQPYAFRAWMYDTRGHSDQAIAEYSQAVRLSPEDADLYLRRAWDYADNGAFAEAIADFKKVLQLDPQNHKAHRGLGWYLATCPDAELRDGKEARKHATTACEATKWQEPRYLNTLAAACAECGDFTQAVQLLVKTLELAPGRDKAYYRRRLELYQSHKPYHLSSQAVFSPLPRNENK